MIEKQLKEVEKNYPSALIENFNFNSVSKESYYARNQLIVDASDELMAFHVNKTQGTQDVISKAKIQKKKVVVTEYHIPQKRVHNKI
jgi:hypothetical protein